MFAGLLSVLLAGPGLAAPKIDWLTPQLSHSLESGKVTTLTVEFTVSEKVKNLDVEVEVVPELAPFVAFSPAGFTDLQGGEVHELQIHLSAPLAFPPDLYTGTLKLRRLSAGIASQPLPIEFEIVADTALPVVTIDSPATGTVFAAGSTVVTGTLDDPFASLAVNGTPVAVTDGAWSLTVPLAEGLNDIQAIATDQVGNVGTARIELIRDTRAPTVAIRLPADGAVAHADSVTVSGLVNDIVLGTVGGTEASVTVNGIAAEVLNRRFLVEGVALSVGDNQITAEATDAAGNTASDSLTVTYQPLAGEARIRALAGDGQRAGIAQTLDQALVAEVVDAQGAPVAGVPVLFRVTGNNGSLSPVAGGAAARGLAVVSDGQGRASVRWTLGSRAGAGNDRVAATAVGYAGTAHYAAITDPGPPVRVNLDAGNGQSGATGRPLAEPFSVVVTDLGHNRLAGVPVTFEIVSDQGASGPGHFNGLTALTVTSDGQGRATALLTLGAAEGIENHRVRASFPDNPNQAAVFAASALQPGDPAETAVVGVVLDNTDLPVPGVTLSLAGTALTAVSDAAGQFRLSGAPVGPALLLADGTTSTRPGPWPHLEFELATVAGRDVDLGRPIHMVRLDETSTLCVDATTGGRLTLPAFPGFALDVAAGSASFADGGPAGCLGVTVVHADKVPMTPNFAQQPRFVVTLQPAGTSFDPPAALSLPNTDGLVPGEITELYSFDHDLGAFVSIGTGTVSEDGLTVTSDPGTGVIKAGWHCGGNPSPTGMCEPVDVDVSKNRVVFLANVNAGQPLQSSPITSMVLATGSPLPTGVPAYTWITDNSDVISVDPSIDTKPVSQSEFSPLSLGQGDTTVTYTTVSGAQDSEIVSTVVAEVKVTQLTVANASSTVFRDNGEPYLLPHWSDLNSDGDAGDDGENNSPVAIVRNTIPVLDVKFSLSESIPPTPIFIRGTGPDGMVFESEVNASGSEIQVNGIESGAPLPNTVRFYNPFTINWDVSLDGGGSFVSAGTTAIKVYSTLDEQFATTLYETVIETGTRESDGESSPTPAVTAIWSEFSDRIVHRVDGAELRFWVNQK